MSTQVDLRRSVVAVAIDDKILGTGFFIGNDGSILTCYHVIAGDREGEDLVDVKFDIFSSSKKYQAKCIFVAPWADIAILRLEDGGLPENTLLLPFGKWEEGDDDEFRTFGFRSPNSGGLPATGKIVGYNDIEDEKKRILILGPEAMGQESIRQGMSGAPVLLKKTNRVVGVINTRLNKTSNYKIVFEGGFSKKEDGAISLPSETTPFAIPIDRVSRVWQPIAKRFQDQILYDRLVEMLSPKGFFTEKALRNLVEDLPPFLKVNWDDLGEDKPQNLLDHFRKKLLLYPFMHWLQRNRAETPDFEGLVLASPYRSFKNRDEEREDIIQGSPYVLLDAPAGFGKTALLREIEIHYTRSNWLCVYIEVPSELPTAREAAMGIQEYIGAKGITLASNISEMGSKLAEILLSGVKDQSEKGVVLLIDNIERMSDEEADKLLNQFLVSMIQYFSDKTLFKIHLAGRYSGPRIISIAKNFTLRHKQLQPFDFKVVLECTKGMNLVEAPAFTLSRAAHLMYVTGGHPRCIAKILGEVSYVDIPEDYFPKNSEKFNNYIVSVADEIRDAIPDDLKEVFDSLSVFRRYNFHLLQKILEAGLVNYSGGANVLEKALTATYLVVRKDGFIRDDIVRRILSIRLRIKEYGRYISLSKKAKEIYSDYLCSTDYRSEYVALECLYQELRLGYFQNDQSAQNRMVFRKKFFAEDGILAQYLQRLVQKPDVQDITRNFLSILNEDWEFKFVTNFFLRNDQFNDDPYNELIRNTEEYFTAHKQG